MAWRRPIWLWVAAGLVCLAGVFVGPAIMAVGTTVWASFQPRTSVSGWDVIALLALLGLVWLGAAFAVAGRLGGRTGLLFAAIAIGVAGGKVVFERAQPPAETTQRTLTGDEAAAWRDFRP